MASSSQKVTAVALLAVPLLECLYIHHLPLERFKHACSATGLQWAKGNVGST